MALVKRECEDVLKTIRETAERQIHEIVEHYDEAKEKVFKNENSLKLSLRKSFCAVLKSKTKIDTFASKERCSPRPVN